jgi:hypothetical protein
MFFMALIFQSMQESPVKQFCRLMVPQAHHDGAEFILSLSKGFAKNCSRKGA